MTLVERRIFRINDFVDNINPAQICVEPMEDPDLDFRMYCGTDILGNATKWLAKDQKARITDLSITDRLNMNANDVVNVGSLYAPWTDLDNDTWARLRFYYNGAYPTSEFVQARPGLECGVRLDSTQSKAHFFCDTNRGLFFNGPEMTLKDYDSDTSKYNFLLTSDSSGSVLKSETGLNIGSAGSLSFFDANILSCEDWDTDTVLLSATEQEVQDCFDLFGETKSVFGMISALPGVTDLQRAYNNGADVAMTLGRSQWSIPADYAENTHAFEIENLLTTNTLSPIKIRNESTVNNSLTFSGDAGSESLGFKIWGNSYIDNISIGRNESENVLSYFLANRPLAGRAKSGIYAIDEDNSFECYVTAEAGTDGLEITGTDLNIYSSHGKILAESGLNGILRIDADVFLSGDGLEFLDQYRSTSDYTGGYIPLSKSVDEWSDFAAIAGATGSLLGAFGACYSGDLQRAYDNGHSVSINNGVCSWTVPSDAAKPSPAQSFSNLKTDNNYEVVLIRNNSTHSSKKAFYFTGDAGDASSSGALGHRLWTPDSISIGRTASTGFKSYFVANQGPFTNPDNRYTNAMIYSKSTGAGDPATEGISYVRARAGGVDEGFANAELQLYVKSGNILLDNYAGGNVTVSANVSLSGGTVRISDGYRSGSDYTGASVPWANSTANWSAFAALAGATGSICDAFAALGARTAALTQGYVAYGNGTGITGEAALFWDSTMSRLYIVGGGIMTSPTGIRSETYGSNNYGIIQIARSLNNTIGSHTAVSTQALGALAFSGSNGSTFVSGAEIRAIGSSATGNWSTAENRAADLVFYTNNAGTLDRRMRLHSEGGITYCTDGDATRDWKKGHFLASQRLDGSTAGSSQSIVAMTLGLRTTSTTANQVLKLNASDSDSPLVLQAGYVYSFLVNITAAYENGDIRGFMSRVYHVTTLAGEVLKSTILNNYNYPENSPERPISSLSIGVAGAPSAPVLSIAVTPSSFCSVDNPINILATISTGVKIKTNLSYLCEDI